MAKCDYKSCRSEAYRHFWMHHFCNEHNWYLRKKAKRENPESLDDFIEEFA
jgi:hypothetical protein